MRALKILLQVKILLTALLWVLPLVFFPASLFPAFGFPAPEPMLFARLLGAAYASLLVGYAYGIRQLHAGVHPEACIAAGLINNGAASALLAGYGLSGHWSTWGIAAQAFMWVSTAGALAMTVALYVLGVRRVTYRPGV